VSSPLKKTSDFILTASENLGSLEIVAVTASFAPVTASFADCSVPFLDSFD
jgi:hypothetical protein